MQDRVTTSLQKATVPVAALVAVTAIGSFLSRTIKKPDELPTNVRHLITNTTRIDEHGTLVNGSWLARDPKDQEWIDASQYVMNRLEESKDIRPQMRFLLSEYCNVTSIGLEVHRDSLIDLQQPVADKTLTELKLLSLWLAHHEKTIGAIPIPKRFSERALASCIEQLTAPYRLTKKNELLATRDESLTKLNQISYFSLPELQK
jgi:hypothetical protein